MALVVTIIILLILAGISIAMLTGDNGLIGKSGEAKNVAEESAIKEELEIIVLASYKKRNIDYNILNNKLSNINGLKYKNNSISESNKITKLPDWVDIKGYKFDILEDGTVDNHMDFETLKSLYGTVVKGYMGYTATDVTEWKLLYVDEQNKDAFIISSDILLNAEIKFSEYAGANDVMKSEYGKKYNSLWLEKCITENKSLNARGTAYLCDSKNWIKYEVGKAKYAVGAPTLEILIASLYNIQVNELETIDESENASKIKAVTQKGYPINFGAVFTSGINNELYNNNKGDYWIASPGNDVNSYDLCRLYSNVNQINRMNTYSKIGLRPVVCLPVSSIEVSGEEENITLNYK